MCLEAEFSACYVMIQQDFFLFNKNLGIIADSSFFSSGKQIHMSGPPESLKQGIFLHKLITLRTAYKTGIRTWGNLYDSHSAKKGGEGS